MRSGEPQYSDAPAAWIRWLVNDVVRGIISQPGIAPVGCHYFLDREREVWEITLFVSRTEIVGGPMDGQVIPSGLQIDIGRVMTAFDSMPEIYWQSDPVAEDDELGNHLSFEGVARGRNVWLRIPRSAPRGIGPGRFVHSATGTIEELW